jgi:hypothetical protein
VFFVDALGFFELAFEDDDAAGGLDRGALVDELTGAGSDLQLVAGVAAVAAFRAQGVIRRASPNSRRCPSPHLIWLSTARDDWHE